MADQQDYKFIFKKDVAQFTPDSLKSIRDNTYMELSMYGIRAAFNRILQCKAEIDIIFTERIKELLMKRSNNAPEYPYAYIVISEMDLLKDRGNTTSMANVGHRSRGTVKSGTSTQIAYLLPTKVSFTLHVIDTDARRLFCTCQSLLLADNSRAFNFNMRCFNTESEVIVKRLGSVSLPDPTFNTSDDIDPNAGHVQLSFEMSTWIGFSTFTPLQNKLVLNYNIIVHDAEGNEVAVDKETRTYEVQNGKDGISQSFVKVE